MSSQQSDCNVERGLCKCPQQVSAVNPGNTPEQGAPIIMCKYKYDLAKGYGFVNQMNVSNDPWAEVFEWFSYVASWEVFMWNPYVSVVACCRGAG